MTVTVHRSSLRQKAIAATSLVLALLLLASIAWAVKLHDDVSRYRALAIANQTIAEENGKIAEANYGVAEYNRSVAEAYMQELERLTSL